MKQSSRYLRKYLCAPETQEGNFHLVLEDKIAGVSALCFLMVRQGQGVSSPYAAEMNLLPWTHVESTLVISGKLFQCSFGHGAMTPPLGPHISFLQSSSLPGPSLTLPSHMGSGTASRGQR